MLFNCPPRRFSDNDSTVKPVGLHSLSWRLGNHRRRGHQARVALGHYSIIQSIPRRSSFVAKGYLLIGKVFANVVKQMLYAVRHAQGLNRILDDP